IAPLQLGNDAQRLGGVVEAAIGFQHFVQRILAGMAERRMAEIMDERHAFGEILVKLQGTCKCPRDLRHLDGMRQARAEMIAVRADENLGLVLQAPESCRMDDAIAVALELGTGRAAILGKKPVARRPWIGRIWGPLTCPESECLPV